MGARSNNDYNVTQLGIVGVAATATQNGSDQTNGYGKGVKVVINTTAFGTSSNVVSIQGKDPSSGAYYTILSTAAITGNSVLVLSVYPGITAATNVSVSDVIPRIWRVIVTSGNANPSNFSIGATVLV